MGGQARFWEGHTEFCAWQAANGPTVLGLSVPPLETVAGFPLQAHCWPRCVPCAVCRDAPEPREMREQGGRETGRRPQQV